jgi:single-stranded-DNA-specific exonuclease
MNSSVPSGKIWKILAGPAGRNVPGEIPSIIRSILAGRGLHDQESISRFLRPSLEQLPPPQAMLGLNQAVSLLREALVNHQPVLIYGDYDADGICATALLANFFREIGLKTACYLPDRLREGYGLNLEALRRLRQIPELAGQKAPIMVTVDCGITNLVEIAEARRLGFRVIVTDHHLPGPELPDADTILNPKQPGCPFPFRELAGVGVAFYLAAGLRAALNVEGFWTGQTAPNLKKYLELVAVGSIADLVPLTGVNRILVKGGLEVLNATPTPGLAALIKISGLTPASLAAEAIAFQLAPRINAAGRIGSAQTALSLLRSESAVESQILAGQLEEANRQRKDLTEKIFAEARQMAQTQLANGETALVLGSSAWHPGIAGLVASRLVNEFWRPCVVLAIDEQGVARGSVRTAGEIDIHAALRACAGLLDKFGGHRQAAGVTLKNDHLPEFAKCFSAAVAKRAAPDDLIPVLHIDLQADLHELMGEPVRHYLKLMEPYGQGNPEPLFCCETAGVKLRKAKKVGSGSLRFQIEDRGSTFTGIGFGLASWVDAANSHPLRLAYKICRNDFQGRERWEIRVEDVKVVS